MRLGSISGLVMAHLVAAQYGCQAQVDASAALYPMNARPVEPLYRRFILLRQ